MLAVTHALKSLNFKGMTVCVRSDSDTCVQYLKHMGGHQSAICNAIAREIWLWCLKVDCCLIPKFIPGKFNIEADYLSRISKHRNEWMLDDQYFHQIVERFGMPDVDLFASRQ